MQYSGGWCAFDTRPMMKCLFNGLKESSPYPALPQWLRCIRPCCQPRVGAQTCWSRFRMPFFVAFHSVLVRAGDGMVECARTCVIISSEGSC